MSDHRAIARESLTATGAFEVVVDGYNAVYPAVARSPTFDRIWREHALGADYPTEFTQISFLTLIELQAVERHLALGPGDALVDLACGAGGPGLWVARESGATLVGIDPSAAGLAEARARAERVGLTDRSRFHAGTFASTGLADAVAEGAMSIDALQYAPDKRAALQEVRRVVRTGGRLVFTAFEVDPTRVAGLPVLGVDPIPDFHPLLEELGFSIETYQESAGWSDRVRATFESVVATMPALTAEMGEEAASALDLEASLTLQFHPYRRRVLVAARAC